MSGPLALEPGGSTDDTLSLRLADDDRERTVALRLPGRGPHEDAVDRLAAELTDRIGPAVHPYEVAAVLESEGLAAEVIRDTYGHPDLFSLAAALHERVPRSFPEPPRPADPWRPDHVRCALRGALFALPGLAHLLTGPLWASGRGVAALVVAGLVSWAWGQALGHRAYLRLASGPRECGRTLLAGAPVGAVLATAAGTAVAGVGPTALFVAGQSVYLAGAGVLLVLGRERLLLAALTPVVAVAAVLPWWEPGTPARVALPLLSVVATVAAAGRALAGPLTTAPAPGATRPRPLLSLPYGLFGLAAGVLVLVEGRREPYAVVVLTVSMGLAEWLLHRYRGLSVAALRAAATPAAFRLRSAGVLGLCLLAYLAPLVPAALLTGAEPVPLLLIAAALWTALLLQAFGVAWVPAAVCLAAAASVGAVTLIGVERDLLALSLCYGAAAAALGAWALRTLGRPSAHA
ncbi:hypothetical protein ACIPJG_33195 [Streptomyces halstedii]|uniref:hypothetical protein n=1 Tax=Streptomyces TaxID=1883 RepID=UPI000804F79A|nr:MULTISPECIES: hypothetical protein [unclassified Streptomyces]MYR71981.1 hypothetical protein [Streptomyces sp. SID4925]SBU99899.1 hypothetical protein YUMDRAFT_06267 [Streptomyces sp. OspMP-M45]